MKELLFACCLLSLLCSGWSCKAYPTPTPSSPAPTTSSTIPQASSKFIDYKYIATALKSGEKIREFKTNRSFALPTGIAKQQIINYFQLKKSDFDNVYFAVFRSGGVKERGELVPQSLERAGVLYAKNDDKQWHIFFEVGNKTEADRNNPYYIWNDENKINLLIHDLVGANNGEGTAKIVSSVDAGKTWRIERCFYLSWSEFNKLRDNYKLNFLATLDKYLHYNFVNNYLNEEYVYNVKTDNFEQRQLNSISGEDEMVSVESCKNINLPTTK